MKDIYERWNLYKEEIELLEELESILLEYSDEDLLNENIMAKALEKVNDFLLKLAMKVQSLGVKALSLLSGAAKVIGKFSGNNPKLAKGIGLVIGMGVIAAILTASPEAAQADLRFQGELITQEQADAAKGILTGIVRDNPDASDTQGLMQAAEWIQDLAEIRPDGKGRSVEGIKGDLGDIMRKSLEKVKEFESEDPARFKRLVKAGEELMVIDPTGSGREFATVDLSLFQGKENTYDMVKGVYSKNLQGADVSTRLNANQDLLDLGYWRENGKLPKGASQKIQDILRRVQEMSAGEFMDVDDPSLRSERYRYLKSILDLGKSRSFTIGGKTI